MNTGFAITTGSMFATIISVANINWHGMFFAIFALAATIISVANINWHGMFFAIFALAACAMAVAVVLTDNVVRMAFYLVLSLGATAGLFFLAGAEFVGAMQLMIYVGGTLVLLVFGVMLTAQAPFVSMKTPQRDWVLASILAVCLLAVLVQYWLYVCWRCSFRQALVWMLGERPQSLSVVEYKERRPSLLQLRWAWHS